MILFVFASLFALVIAGPDEDTADKILSAFIKDNAGKDVPSSSFVYAYNVNLGIITTSIDVSFNDGQLNLKGFSRTGPVDNTGGLTFTAEIDAKLNYAYDFRSSVPAPFAAGKAAIDWKAPVSMKVVIDENNRASLDSIRLLNTGTLIGDAIPYVAGRSATLFPKQDSPFARLLFLPMQGYLRNTFKNIAY
ncbi:unnamed protein product [Nezara viridula]|uniref:Uncharacterized protein n=1 Tax=Nezara viridula TaxID=85310 RepID=A0A9P0HM74_NEZVI|nr:unnamed protein product [Nezara viridula]